MRIAIPKESTLREKRVAVTPDTVARLVKRGIDVSVQRGAGVGAHALDDDYATAGARIEPDAATTWCAGDVIVKVRAPSPREIDLLREGQTLIALLAPIAEPERVRAIAARGVTALAADLVPRTSVAQMMDVLSSQASIAGYRAVLLAAEASPRMFPMMMTAAGTVAPARVLVLGAGVAGLQAIATARRLGAIVEAFDVRRVVKEQVESLGARFIEVPGEDGAGSGGYAKEVTDDYKRKQAELVTDAIARADVCITTAQVPGKRAPVLVTAAQAQAMRAGSVIVDLAAEQGGNCELTRPDERHLAGSGVFVIGDTDLASQVAVHASQMYSRNMEKLIVHYLGAAADDEIVRAMRVGEPIRKELAA